MSQTTSPLTKEEYGLKQVCAAWDIPRSTLYRHKLYATGIPKKDSSAFPKKGPKPSLSDEELMSAIQADLEASPFKGEGHRKVHARLKRNNQCVGRNRVLKLMKQGLLLSPHRSINRPPNPHDGRITTDGPNQMWGSDGTKILTVDDGWVWIFDAVEHWNGECVGWHACKIGDRFAALEPIMQGVKSIYGSLEKGVAKGLKLRIDNGSQYTSDYLLQQISYWGVEASFGLVRQPETNGVAERFHRTLKDQILCGRIFQNLDEVREAVSSFVINYNKSWLLEKLGYQSPSEARRSHKQRGAA